MALTPLTINMESTSRPTNGPTSTQIVSIASFEMSSHSQKMTAGLVTDVRPCKRTRSMRAASNSGSHPEARSMSVERQMSASRVMKSETCVAESLATAALQ